jgi:hypothetical protein
MIMGLYPYIRNGERRGFKAGLMEEIADSLNCNPFYAEQMMFLAADSSSARILEARGLRVLRIFEDAPEHVWRDTVHKMKHWMGLWALREFGEYLWVDWDTVAVAEPDENFWEGCRSGGTPKYIRIEGYKHAVVNCGVLYVPAAWAAAMERSLHLPARSSNDEHLWEAVLPADVLNRPEFWFGTEVRYISGADRADRVTSKLCFAHLGRGCFDAADAIRAAHRNAIAKPVGSHAN